MTSANDPGNNDDDASESQDGNTKGTRQPDGAGAQIGSQPPQFSGQRSAQQGNQLSNSQENELQQQGKALEQQGNALQQQASAMQAQGRALQQQGKDLQQGRQNPAPGVDAGKSRKSSNLSSSDKSDKTFSTSASEQKDSNRPDEKTALKKLMATERRISSSQLLSS
jgi:hypothetical protein